MRRNLITILCCAGLATAAWAAGPAVDADNTGKNERDRSGETSTPFDQSENSDDIKLVAGIRKAVVADDQLSMTAKNVKIITANGEALLRGPVATAEEKEKIAAYAKKAGATKVINQLEIKKTE